MQKIKIGIVGCGALTQSVYLPLLTGMEEFEVEVLSDKNIDAAHNLANAFNIPNVTEHIDLKRFNIELAIIVVPNAFHYAIAKSLMKDGINVLIEKPCCVTSENVKELITVKTTYKLTGAVGHVRRFYKNNIFIKDIIQNGTFGKPVSFSFEEGYYLNELQATDTFVNKSKSGGGVLIDTGPHIIDLLLWWLGDVNSFEYYDDALGGIEAECLVEINFANGVTGRGTLSRLRKLKNSIIISFEKAICEISTSPNQMLKIQIEGENDSFAIKGDINGNVQTVKDAFKDQLLNVYHGVLAGTVLRVDIADSYNCVRFIEQCYNKRKPITEMYETF
jgi:predicted dehydrogenase